VVGPKFDPACPGEVSNSIDVGLMDLHGLGVGMIVEYDFHCQQGVCARLVSVFGEQEQRLLQEGET
jgi:hypothetical protein